MDKLLLQRIEELRNAIAWSKEHGGLTTGQRICIHQEIAVMLQHVEEGGIFFLPHYAIIGKALQEKVDHINQVIKNTSWRKQECKY